MPFDGTVLGYVTIRGSRLLLYCEFMAKVRVFMVHLFRFVYVSILKLLEIRPAEVYLKKLLWCIPVTIFAVRQCADSDMVIRMNEEPASRRENFAIV